MAEAGLGGGATGVGSASIVFVNSANVMWLSAAAAIEENSSLLAVLRVGSKLGVRLGNSPGGSNPTG